MAVAHDFLSCSVFANDFKSSPDAKAVRLSTPQPELDPAIACLALIDEELTSPDIPWPHSTQARVDVLQPIVVEIKENDPVSFLDCAKSVQHRNVRHPTGKLRSVRFAHVK